MLLTATALLALAATTPRTTFDEDDPLAAELERLGWEWTEKVPSVPGVGLALVRGGKLVRAFGCGWADLEGEREVTGDTVFSAGSISKTVAAWGLMCLVERGELELDAPVATRRWQLPASSFDPKGVTLRRLLSHTAGLSLHGYPGFWPGDELPTLERSLSGDTNGAGDVRLEAEPGAAWEYSGGGYTLAQLLLEETTGESFAVHLRTHVLVPLGMTSSGFGWDAALLERSATPYDVEGKPGPRGSPCFPELAAAGFLTTPADLARFALASMPRWPDAPRGVLAPETIERMQAAAPNAPEYGLGYQRLEEQGVAFLGHGGANLGWIAQLAFVPESGDALVVLTNGSHGSAVVAPLVRRWLEHVKAEREARAGAPGK
jgi:CubicO group peptidase (beta-lactamase class C family)